MRELFLGMSPMICITKPSKCMKVRSDRYNVEIIDCSRCCHYKIEQKFSFIMPKTTLPKNVMSGLLDFIIRRGALTKGRWDQLKRVKFGLKIAMSCQKLRDTVVNLYLYFLFIFGLSFILL
jgi:hypothetical protein